ncbi:darcynin [Amycolatopsis mongoliensis]|uniref:Darcynin n=1 Tax=Amycolatopsis mongoliensis TaxID=715475 RepID=A0A9Y2NAM1_9PSEU|nr:darcynin family protein [Amycolatopsis sp. 4-36]WIX98740.1 darcynin [Amycolatopsis sp. 4-36]
MTVEQRIAAFRTEVVPAIEEKAKGVRSRFYDTEFYSARVTDVWVWEAVDHAAYQRLVDVLRETPFWDRWFDVAEILVGVEKTATRTTTASTWSPASRPRARTRSGRGRPGRGGRWPCR